MSYKLVIVESPAKAKTIQKYLGKDFQVAASMGHVRDLPRKSLSIDIDHDFAPDYEITKQKVVTELRQKVRQADAIYLATDPDREGEAIAWHITQAINIPRTKAVHRVVFQEITRSAVQQAVANPRQVNDHLVEAQQARRVLDRLVGYQLSPLLWDKVKRGLSAGRVQSVAVRLIVEREREIEAFVAVEYWTIEIDVRKQLTNGQQPESLRHPFRAVLIERAGQKLDKFAIPNQEQAQAIVADLNDARYVVQKITRKDRRRKPAPPFTTSTLQQEAGRKLGFSAKKTMMLAQQLYEGIDIGGDDGSIGLITYMRTDSTSVSKEAQDEAREVISTRYGREYLPEQAPVYKTRAKSAQEAHEAIRPTSSKRLPDDLKEALSRDQLRLYDLIWKRFVASQMAPAIFDSTTVDIAAIKGASQEIPTPPPYTFRATGSVVKFAGFLAVYSEGRDEGDTEEDDSEKRLPPLSERELLELLALMPLQHFTEPPPRYTEASLVKELERLGIGRPSTYAPIISTIQERGYVSISEKKLLPTSLGRVVTDLLVEHFASIVDYDFTSGLEQQLDDIATGEKQWVPVLRDFYGSFEMRLQEARETMRNVKTEEIPSGITCPRCEQGELLIKFGRNGEFLACSRYQKGGGDDSCDFTSDFHRDSDGKIVLDTASTPEMSDVMCHLCGRPMVIKKSRFGPFLGCSGYPECNATRRIGKDGKPVPLPEPTGVTCPKCQQGELLKRRGKFGRHFFSCGRYPECDYATNDLAQVEHYVSEEATEQAASNGKGSSSKTSTTTATVAKSRTGSKSTTSKSTTSKKTTSKSTVSKRTASKKTTSKSTTNKRSVSKKPGTSADASSAASNGASKPAKTGQSNEQNEAEPQPHNQGG
ncbi:MAG: type I DNA topoisomerase [Chloroflexaceae bacterium]|nr:type I DNA topoisomerase [Chloroflexaceae bacterium]